jgi:hypothetical protein
MRRLENLVHSTPSGPGHDCIIWVHLFERVNYRFMLVLIGIFVLVSTAGGIAFAVLQGDVATGVAISTYMVGFLSIATGIWGIGDHLGIERPDMHTYSFDVVHGADEVRAGEDVVRGGLRSALVSAQTSGAAWWGAMTCRGMASR